jgi:hypothetical protein
MYGRNEYKIQSENLKGKDYLGDLNKDGRKLLKSTLEKYYVKKWTGFIWLRTRSSGWLL